MSGTLSKERICFLGRRIEKHNGGFGKGYFGKKPRVLRGRSSVQDGAALCRRKSFNVEKEISDPGSRD